MSVYFSILLFLMVILNAEARSHFKHHGRGPPHRGRIPLGPVHAILRKLTEDQRRELFSGLKDSENATKAEIKTKIDSFVAGLSTELKNDVAQAESKFENMKKKDDEKAKTLSTEAQSLYSSIKKVLDDTSITFKEEHEKVHALVEAANQSTVKELRDAHIHMPGIGPPPGPRHHGHPGHPHHGRQSHSHKQPPNTHDDTGDVQ
ncbi:hypothetical protein M3Y98_01005400 [Aphelenchoides besseyi]|nr:hypothetical protein M3Y98_01005400 [Aphelenchoides besseyi]KAI6195198.1 hypothetical protein M3Y96_01205500 [Aphelenchoides besseyi]